MPSSVQIAVWHQRLPQLALFVASRLCCLFPPARHVGTSAHRHVGTSARRHIGTSARRHVGTPAGQRLRSAPGLEAESRCRRGISPVLAHAALRPTKAVPQHRTPRRGRESRARFRTALAVLECAAAAALSVRRRCSGCLRDPLAPSERSPYHLLELHMVKCDLRACRERLLRWLPLRCLPRGLCP